MSELPQSWSLASLDQVARSIQYGYTASSSPELSGPQYLRITDIQQNAVDWTSVPRVPMAPGQHEYRLENGDIVFARSGATVGKSYLVLDPPEDAIFASYLIRVRPDARLFSPNFSAYFFRSPDYWSQIKLGSTGTGQPNFNGSKLAKLLVPVAPLAEQRRIVAKLDALTAQTARARADLDRVPALAVRYKQAVLAAAFRGALTSDWRAANPQAVWSGDAVLTVQNRREAYVSGRRGSRLRDAPDLVLPSERTDLPETWLKCCFADVSDLKVGYAFKSNWFANEGPKLLRGANVGIGALDWDDTKRLDPTRVKDFAEYILQEGDIVLAMDRPIISSGLKIARVGRADAGSLLVQRVACPKLSSLISADFAWWLLNSHHLIGQIERHATGSDLPHISGNDILTTPTPLPPLEEQAEIARRLDKAFTQINRLTGEAASSRHLLDRLDEAILVKAFRGELVPQEPADEPASALLARIKAEREDAPVARRGRRPKAA